MHTQIDVQTTTERKNKKEYDRQTDRAGDRDKYKKRDYLPFQILYVYTHF